MAEKTKSLAAVVSQEKIATDIYSLILATPAAQKAVAGQFVSVYCKDRTKLLPRPISICEINREAETLRLVYRVTGKGTGTEEFSRLKAGDWIEVLGPLGNGFPLKKGKAFLIGGGIGIPPMVQAAKELAGQEDPSMIQVIAGYRSEQFLTQELSAYGTLYIATEDGSAGTKGTVLDAVREHALDAEVIYACGPRPMLRAVKEYAEEHGIECWISMEERMACGIGACLACVCGSTEVDGHSHVKNKRVCKDGPVFLSTEVEL